MKNRGLLAAGAAMAILGASGNAAAQSCITRAEIAGMMSYAMPSMIEAARDECRAHLSPDAFVATGVDAMVASYRADQAASWPAARAAFVKFGGGDNARDAKMMAKIPDNVLQPMVEAMVPAMIQEEIKPESCRDIDTILASLAPLAPGQAADLIASIMALAGMGKAGERSDQPSVCTE